MKNTGTYMRTRKLDYQIKYLQDHRTQCIEAKDINWYVIEAIDQAIGILQALKENRLLILPVPIGAEVYIPGSYEEIDGSTVFDIDKTKLSGYIKENDREFYTTYDENCGTMDVEKSELCTTHEEAKKKLEQIKNRKCRVCGCTWEHACQGGCYWVEENLCSKCVGFIEKLGDDVK